MAFQNFGWPAGRIPDFRLDALRKERLELLRNAVDLSLLDLDVRIDTVALLAKPQPRPQLELLEVRSAAVADINQAKRTLRVIAVPYSQVAQVEWRGELWNEVFERTAFTDINTKTTPIRVNRNHNRTLTVGKVTSCEPNHPQGLLTEIRIARTPLGDETLALADEDCLSASIGFGAYPQDCQINKRTMTRHIKKAQLDHIALVESPAYSDARVVSVVE